MMAPVIILQANSNLINLRLQNYLIKFTNIYLQVHLLAQLKILKIQSRSCTERTLYSELFEDLCGSRGALLKKNYFSDVIVGLCHGKQCFKKKASS